jgi:hypothetical protein
MTGNLFTCAEQTAPRLRSPASTFITKARKYESTKKIGAPTSAPRCPGSAPLGAPARRWSTRAAGESRSGRGAVVGPAPCRRASVRFRAFVLSCFHDHRFASAIVAGTNGLGVPVARWGRLGQRIPSRPMRAVFCRLPARRAANMQRAVPLPPKPAVSPPTSLPSHADPPVLTRNQGLLHKSSSRFHRCPLHSVVFSAVVQHRAGSQPIGSMPCILSSSTRDRSHWPAHRSEVSLVSHRRDVVRRSHTVPGRFGSIPRSKRRSP